MTKAKRKATAKEEFHWKPGSFVKKGLSPEVFAKALEEIRAEHGAVTSALIVDKGRAKNSPIHEFFNWDNPSAAEEHRKDQAAYYRRHIIVVTTEPGAGAKEQATQRVAFLSYRNEEGGHESRDAVEVMSQEELAHQVLYEAVRYFMYGRKRFAHIKELSRLFSVIDAVASKIDDTKEAVTS